MELDTFASGHIFPTPLENIIVSGLWILMGRSDFADFAESLASWKWDSRADVESILLSLRRSLLYSAIRSTLPGN
jgi:hypothetical protein